jgi:sugar phosphate isomerase/epimerase
LLNPRNFQLNCSQKGALVVFKLGYSTYALKMVDPFEALRLIKDVGYEALEVCAADGWPSAPEEFSASQQDDLAKLASDLGFGSPILFALIDICATGSDQAAMLESTKRKFDMVQRLHFDNSPILITTTPGHSAPEWDSGKEQIRDRQGNAERLLARHPIRFLR